MAVPDSPSDTPAPRNRDAPRRMCEDLQQLTELLAADFGDRWITKPSQLRQFAIAEGHHKPVTPDLVVRPQSTEEVSRLMQVTNELGIAVVPLGVGTSLEGNASAISGAVSIDMSAMNRIVDVSADDLLCVVQPGVTRSQLNTELRATGLFFPIDPGADATLGGMIATRASGTNAVRYGTMRENVLALTVVLPDGTVVRTGSRARKSAAGYDLTHLFTGSEGTLGVIVDATIRLHGIPETVLAGSWTFNTLQSAIETVIVTIQLGIPVARIELLDPAAIRACNRFAGLDLPEKPTLFIELHGSPSIVAHQRQQIADIGAMYDCGELVMATDPDERRRLWQSRHDALPAARALASGSVIWSTDICVPISHLADAIVAARAAIDEADLLAPLLGHVGDGNFHVFFVLDPDDGDQWQRAKAVNQKMIDFALSVGGTCTGEHGIGLGKREALIAEHGETAVALMRALKNMVDPGNRMNPGKLFIQPG